MNHAVIIIKVDSKPVFFNQCDQELIKIDVKFSSSKRKESEDRIELVLWGEHKENFLKYYQIHDYLLVEGIVVIDEPENAIKLTSKRLYPYFLEE